MKRLYALLLAALAAAACIQDPDAPMNLPDVPVISVDETSVTRVSMLVNGVFGKDMTDISAYGVEVSETLFENGGTYQTLAPQEVTGGAFSLGVTGLKSNSTYFLRAFISNGHSKMYSSIITQQTPETSVASVSDVAVRDGFLVASIEDNGGRSVEDVGFMWGTSSERKELKREKRYVGTLSEDGKTFTLPLSMVGYGTYYVMAYAEDDKDGTGYSRIPLNVEMQDPSQPNSEIWYSSVDGVVVNPTVKDGFGARIVSNTNEDGKGVIAFDGPVTRIPESAFRQSRLVTVTLPGSVEEVGRYAFDQNGAERTLEAFYGKGASQDHLSLVFGGTLVAVARMNEELDFVIPDGVTKVERGVFEQCHYRSITLPEGLKDTEYGFPSLYHLEAFYGPQTSEDHRCVIIDGELRAVAPEGLTSYVVTDPITGVGNYALYNGFSQIGRLILPESATYIGSQAFGQTQIDTLGLPAHLKEIRDEAFYAMYGLISLTVPEEVETIGSRAFGQAGRDYGGLYNITFLPTVPPVIKEDTFAELLGDGPFFVPAESVEAYKTARYWSAYADRILPIGQGNGVSAKKYLTFTSEGTTKISLSNSGGNAPVLYYSYDAQNWTPWDYSELTFTAEASLYICGDNPQGFSTSLGSYDGAYSTFVSSGSLFSVSGDIMSLLNYETDLSIIPSSFCFVNLFRGCSSLTGGPSLPATTLAPYCYREMFRETSLTVAPVLPATELTPYCYDNMFTDCQNLSVAPSLPATTLAEGCYEGMFISCTALTEAPELPATLLATSCYKVMFQYCSNLTVAPELPAITLARGCYDRMFNNCKRLNYVRCLATDISSDSCVSMWLSNVASTGTFVKSAQMDDWPTGESGIPEGWTVEIDNSNPITASKYLTFTSEGTTKLSMYRTGGHAPIIFYSTDASTWKQWDYSELTFTSESPLYICGDNSGRFSNGSAKWSRFVSSGDNFSVSGDTMSLLDRYDDQNEVKSWCFTNLFADCQNLTSPPSLPATILDESCYSGMFSRCSSLVSAPQLPATTMASGCYTSMFNGCSSLTTAPSLPAMSLAPSCYYMMFAGCTSLTAAPELPATSIPDFSCYGFMFSGCTFTQPPALPATQLGSSCYEYMFDGCVNLVTAPELPATTMTFSCYSRMFYGCTSLVEAPQLPATDLAEACYEEMFYGCTSLTEAPNLPAKKLSQACYENMFWGCSRIGKITCFATDISASRCTDGWVYGVASTGTFVKSAQMNDWPTGTSGIPEGWTVVDAQ